MKAIYGIYAMFAALFFTVIAWAQEVVPVPVPETLDQALGFISGLIVAAQSSNWLAFGAGCAMILTFAVKTYVLPKIGLGNGVLPWVSLLLGAVTGYGGAILAGASHEAAMMALLSGPVASMLWAAIAQYIFPKPA